MCIYLAPTNIIYSLPASRCCCVIWASAAIAAAWFISKRISSKDVNLMAFIAHVATVYGVPSPCDHSCMVCVTLSFSLSFSFSLFLSLSLSRSLSLSLSLSFSLSLCFSLSLFLSLSLSVSLPLSLFLSIFLSHVPVLLVVSIMSTT